MIQDEWRDPEGPEKAKQDLKEAVNILFLGIPWVVEKVANIVAPNRPPRP